MGRKQPSENLDKAINTMYRKTKDLRRLLRKAVVDHVSDRLVDNKIFYTYQAYTLKSVGRLKGMIFMLLNSLEF